MLSGSTSLMMPFGVVLFIAFCVKLGGMKGSMFTAVIPLVLLFIFKVLGHPSRTLYAVLTLSFCISGLSRYIKLPWGLGIDIFLVVAWLVLFVKEFRNLKTDRLNNDFAKLSGIWMLYVLMEVVNPESRSFMAWFYAMRGVSFYFLLVISLTLMTLRDVKHIDKFINTVIFISILGAIWAMKQKFIGVDAAEHHWLWVEGHYDEHVLFGVLRAFSFYSDAGQFGASQIMVAMLCGILLFQRNISFKLQLFYVLGFLFTFVGFGISGSRGPMIIPAIGGVAFLFLLKNFKILILGGLVMFSTFGMLKYTTILHNVEQVRRMRTALAPDNPSLQARKRNQKTFARYLKTRPIGGGIGSAGYWGNRFSPHTLLAQTPTDSYYVKIWAETGIIGVCLHSGILGFFLGRIVAFIGAVRDPNLKYKAMGLVCSIIGIMGASYGNQVFSQMPTGIIMPIAFGLLYMIPEFDKQLQIEKEKEQ